MKKITFKQLKKIIGESSISQEASLPLYRIFEVDKKDNKIINQDIFHSYEDAREAVKEINNPWIISKDNRVIASGIGVSDEECSKVESYLRGDYVEEII